MAGGGAAPPEGGPTGCGGELASGPARLAHRPSRPARLRFRFAKLGKVRFTSQRDVARMWERALRRSGLPVAWTEGFSPRPLLSFGLALPTGSESLAEYVDVRLQADVPLPPASLGAAPAEAGSLGAAPAEAGSLGAAPLPPAPLGAAPVGAPGALSGTEDPLAVAARLTELLPDGITVTAAAALGHAVGSLQQQVTSCTWEMEVRGVAVTELEARIGRLLDAPSVPVRRERKGRAVVDDLRPSVLRLVPMPGDAGAAPAQTTCRIRAELATQPRGVRPGELLEGLGAGLVLVRARRTHQWIERDGVRSEPLPLGGGAGAAVSKPRGGAS